MTAHPTTPPWWAALPPVATKVPCGSAKHQLRWQDGRLLAVDHPDAESELVLAALGGDEPGCIKVVRNWGAHSEDLDVLALAPRSAKDELALPLKDRAGPTLMRSGWSAYGPGSRPMMRQDRVSAAVHAELVELLGLGRGFQLRLAATVAASWSGRVRDQNAAGARPALTAALSGRLAPAAADWLKVDPAQVDVTCHQGDGWGELAMAGPGQLRAALPVGWLASVWAAGLAVLDGSLVVGLGSATWPAIQVLAVTRPGEEPVARTAIHRNGRWSMRRRPGRSEEAT